MYCLDTNTISFALMNKYGVGEKVLQTNVSEMCTTIITELELVYGAYNSQKVEYNLQQINKFLEVISIYNLNREILDKFAKEKVRLKLRGEIIEDMDILIASICLTQGFTLVTDNIKHFRRFKGLQLVNWCK
jgi:tRNA(fMet)-specific endonuclease VapC